VDEHREQLLLLVGRMVSLLTDGVEDEDELRGWSNLIRSFEHDLAVLGNRIDRELPRRG
jgi:hypothetical protein